jgi:hypothetical protein
MDNVLNLHFFLIRGDNYGSTQKIQGLEAKTGIGEGCCILTV